MQWILVALVGVAILLRFLGENEPRRHLRAAAFYLLCVDLILVVAWVAGWLPGRVA